MGRWKMVPKYFHWRLALVGKSPQHLSLLTIHELATCAEPWRLSIRPAAPEDKGHNKCGGTSCVRHYSEATPGCRWGRRKVQPRQPYWGHGGARGGGSGAGAGRESGGRIAAGKGMDEEGPGAQRTQDRGAGQRDRDYTPPAEWGLELCHRNLSSPSAVELFCHLLAPS